MIKTEESTRAEDQSTVSDRGLLDQTSLMQYEMDCIRIWLPITSKRRNAISNKACFPYISKRAIKTEQSLSRRLVSRWRCSVKIERKQNMRNKGRKRGERHKKWDYTLNIAFSSFLFLFFLSSFSDFNFSRFDGKIEPLLKVKMAYC